jgi:hypothetical protein
MVFRGFQKHLSSGFGQTAAGGDFEKWSPKAKTPDEANTSETAVEAAHTKCMFQTRSVFGNAQHCGHHLWGNMMAFGLGSPDVETRKCGIDSFTYGVRGGVHTGDRRRG